jgi:ribose transport system substrate-binding protein
MSKSKTCLAALGAAIALAWAGTARAAEQPTLGLAAIDLQQSFFVRMKQAGDTAATDYGVKATWQSAEGSLEKQVALIENFINQKVSVILVDPLDKNALLPVINKATAAHIPVITMGNKVNGNGNYSTLYPDYQNMSVVARALGTTLGGEGEVALLVGTRGNFVSDTREKAFVDTLGKEFPHIKIVGVQPTLWDSAKATDAAQTWLTTYPDLKAIGCISDSMCLAASAVAQGMDRKLLYAGYDGDEEMHPLLDDGSMVMDVLTGAYRVGYWNIAVAARLARGETLPHDLYMPTFFVMSPATQKALAAKGLNISAIDTATASRQAKGYSEQLGPSKQSADMTVAQ